MPWALDLSFSITRTGIPWESTARCSLLFSPHLCGLPSDCRHEPQFRWGWSLMWLESIINHRNYCTGNPAQQRPYPKGLSISRGPASGRGDHGRFSSPPGLGAGPARVCPVLDIEGGAQRAGSKTPPSGTTDCPRLGCPSSLGHQANEVQEVSKLGRKYRGVDAALSYPHPSLSLSQLQGINM